MSTRRNKENVVFQGLLKGKLELHKSEILPTEFRELLMTDFAHHLFHHCLSLISSVYIPFPVLSLLEMTRLSLTAHPIYSTLTRSPSQASLFPSDCLAWSFTIAHFSTAE
jgi:hypothetical protein